ncbi:MAG: OsmC family protein [Chloroflexi bacterium]|nr:OsmC family protein [Chloroflexota bacterium]
MNEYTCDLRAAVQDSEPATVYIRKHRFSVGAPLHFDQEYPYITALEHALGALAADIAGGLQAAARRHRVPVDHIEAVLTGRLNNPLTYLGVVGEEGHPGLERVAVTVYVSSPAAQEEVQRLWIETLQRSPLVSTFRKAVHLELSYQIVL